VKTNLSNRNNQGLTRIDVLALVLISIFLILFSSVLLIPMKPNSKAHAPRIQCVSNLKQVGLAARIWEGDNGGKYPMELSVTNGGGMELVATGNVAGLFQIMSNELSTTKILICPADTDHVIASNFFTLNNSNISYFVNVEATETYPQMIFLGDDNLAIGDGKHLRPVDGAAEGDVPVNPGIVELTTNAIIAWTGKRHRYVGNVSFADGSVAEESSSGLANTIQYNFIGTRWATNHWAIP
jgi:prepilin-type processing-associated H-X9-DG protein